MFNGYGCSPLMVDGVLRRAAAAAMAEVYSRAAEIGISTNLQGGGAEIGISTNLQGGGAGAGPCGAVAGASHVSDPAVTLARLCAESERMLHRCV
jgi:hypothetical protein